MAAPSRTGAGKDWSRTLRHKVAGLNGSGAGRVGCLGSRTSCDWRTSAESGSSSKLGIAAVVCVLLALVACVVWVIFYSVVRSK